MTASTGIVQTTHAGSLPRTPEILAANEARAQGRDSGELDQLLTTAVVDVVARQKAAGIEIANDGEYGHTMTGPVDYGAWWNYVFARLGGLEQTDFDRWADRTQHRSSPGHIVLTSFYDRRDRARFREAYEEPTSGILAHRKAATQPKVAGPLTYIGHDDVRRDAANLTNALRENGMSTGFIASLSPGSCARITNEYYATEEELLFACADAMREEYIAILDAGLNVQLDDPSLAENWDQITPEPSVADYQQFTQLRIDALNHAIEGLPTELVRLHLCWGSWHGPHTTDIGIADILPVVLNARVGSLSFEAGNVRHEHEWVVWRDVAVPDDLVLVPGVVSHATNVVEHPDLVAQRIRRFTDAVGADRVIASTDCGLGGRVHADVAWAKLGSLGEGARRAIASAS